MINKELTPEEIAENVVNKTDIIKAITHERKLRQEAESKLKLVMDVVEVARVVVDSCDFRDLGGEAQDSYEELDGALMALDKWVGMNHE